MKKGNFWNGNGERERRQMKGKCQKKEYIVENDYHGSMHITHTGHLMRDPTVQSLLNIISYNWYVDE